jgi:hypothetical protein
VAATKASEIKRIENPKYLNLLHPFTRSVQAGNSQTGSL